MQNTGSNQEKQKLSKILPATKLMKGYGGYWWWRGDSLTHKSQIYSYSGRYRLPYSNYATFHEPCILWKQCQRYPIQDRGGYIPLSPTRQCSFMYLNLFLYSSFGVFDPTPKYFKDVSTYFRTRKYCFCQNMMVGSCKWPLRPLYLIYIGVDEV